MRNFHWYAYAAAIFFWHHIAATLGGAGLFVFIAFIFGILDAGKDENTKILWSDIFTKLRKRK